MAVTMGVAPGSRSEPAAIAVVEAERRDGPWHYTVRHLEHLPTNTPLPVLAKHVGRLIEGVKERTGAVPNQLYADVTGRGSAITDLIQERAREVYFVTPAYFTHGDRRLFEDGKVTLGKGFLVGRLQTLLQAERLHLPESKEARTLAEELLAYEIKVDPAANERYGAFRVGTRDELVTALGLAVQAKPPVWSVNGVEVC